MNLNHGGPAPSIDATLSAEKPLNNSAEFAPHCAVQPEASVIVIPKLQEMAWRPSIWEMGFFFSWRSTDLLGSLIV